MTAFALVMAGGAAGSMVRALLVAFVGGRFPWAILIANVVGSLGLGFLLASAPPQMLLFAGVGFCGALTTMSAFAMDTHMLMRARRSAAATANVALSVGAAVMALVAGMSLGRLLGT